MQLEAQKTDPSPDQAKGKPLFSKYLGAPLFHGFTKRQLFNSLMDRMHSKLVGWKSKLLSLAGRRILIRHMLSSMAIHIAMVFRLPKSVIYIMERIMINFFWSAGATPSA